MWRVRGMIICAASGLSCTAVAQDIGPATSVNQVNDLEIIVTARRRKERIQDIPFSVVPVSAQDLSKAGVASVRNLESVVSGVTTGGQGFQTNLAIRGVSTFQADGASAGPNAVYVDGVYEPMNTPLSAELPDIERIEVLKGPQGTLFGRNATGGAIRVTTRQPSFKPEMDVTMRLGLFDGAGTSRPSSNVNMSAFVTGPLVADRLAVSLSLSSRYTPGYYTDDATGQQDGEIKKQSVRGKLLFTPSSGVRITLEGHYIGFFNLGESLQSPYQGLTAASIYPGTVIPDQPWHTAYSDGFDQVRLSQPGASLTGEFNLFGGVLTAITAYSKTNIRTLTSIAGVRATPACLAAFACIDFDFDYKSKNFMQELNYNSRRFGPFIVTTGLFYYNLKSHSLINLQRSLIPGGIPAGEVRVNNATYAAYGEGTADVTNSLALIAGIRYSHETSDDNPAPGLPNVRIKSDAWTPRLSLRYEPAKGVSLYATYSKGFVAPQSGARNLATVPPFQPVAAETLNAYEIGAKFLSSNASLGPVDEIAHVENSLFPR